MSGFLFIDRRVRQRVYDIERDEKLPPDARRSAMSAVRALAVIGNVGAVLGCFAAGVMIAYFGWKLELFVHSKIAAIMVLGPSIGVGFFVWQVTVALQGLALERAEAHR